MSNEAGSSKAPATLTDASFDAFSAELQATALTSTKLAAALPADIGFHRSVDKEFARSIESCSERTLHLTNKLLELSTSHTRSKGKAKLQDEEDVLDSFRSLVGDVLDQLFEQADMNMDEYFGRPKPATVPVKAVQPSAPAPLNRQGRLDPSLTHASHLVKPQLKFKPKVDNANDSVWALSLKHKYNAQVPLGYVLHDSSTNGETSASARIPHPYRYEIEHISYPHHMFEHRNTTAPKSFEETPFTWVDTRRGLDAMLERLRTAREIAVDLEHHSYRSYFGFLCLMQITTREEDFIVDTLTLREELEDLNEVFTDPKIVKVFHGADSDIVWLQQDFNIYVVNLFDTFHGSKLLEFPRHGLAALLEMYCDFIPDKRYQLADWRIRPLPSEMLNYARSDTHFLLYIYDNLRNALLDRVGGQPDLVREVLARSQETALRTYEREVYDYDTGGGSAGWDTLALKWGRVLTGTPRAVFRAVHAWRDELARTEDESTRYVLPNHYLFQLAERPPADMAALLGVFRPVPQLVRTKAASLLEAIRAAVRESMTRPDDRKDEEKPQVETPAPATAVTHYAQKANGAESVGGNNAVKVPELWVAPTSSTSVAARASALLGSISTMLKRKPQARSVTTSTSMLFPTGESTTLRARQPNSSSRYGDVVSRIHSSLVVAPSLPKVTLPNATTIVDPSNGSASKEETVVEELRTEQIEIAYVPAEERQVREFVKTEVTDSIVVVGRQKKRKRSKQQTEADTLGSADPTESRQKRTRGKAKTEAEANGEAPEAKSFDYASAPNFFDGPMKSEASVPKTAKTKPTKARAVEKGDFPAPPRAHNEPKGANKSYTFGK